MKRLVIILTALAFTACAGGSDSSKKDTGDKDTSVQDFGTNNPGDTQAPTDTPASQDTAVVDDTTTLDFTAPPVDTATPDVTRVQPGANSVGQICNQQTQCPMGYTCLATPDATNGFCSKPCTPGQGTDDCGAGYAGIGVPNCFMGVEDQAGNVSTFCGIICKANEAPDLTGECPVGMECTAPLQDAAGNEVATGCVVSG